jgi:hypothetical protein
MRINSLALTLWLLLSSSVTPATTLKITARTNPSKIPAGGSSVIAIKVTDGTSPKSNQPVKLELMEGVECGSIRPDTGSTDGNGNITVQFYGLPNVENCVARIRATAVITPPDNTTAEPADTTIIVNPDTGAMAKLDGISVIALIIILSFAIDRIVRGLFFLLSYVGPWARALPEPDFSKSRSTPKIEQNRKLIYFVLSATLGIVALAWFGRIRILAALGFTSVNPWLDVLVTGLILVGGAERTEQVLKGIGAGGYSGSSSESKPLEITGRLVIDDRSDKSN